MRTLGAFWIGGCVLLGFAWGAVDLFNIAELPPILDFLGDFGGVWLIALLALPGVLMYQFDKRKDQD